MRFSHLLIAPLIPMLLAACVAHGPSQNLAGHDGLERQIRDSYRRLAVEQNGLCIRPEIGIITKSQIIEDSDQQLIVNIRHTLRADIEESARSDIRRPLRTCPSFGQRTFVFDKQGGELTFVSMSGPNRPETRYNFNRN